MTAWATYCNKHPYLPFLLPSLLLMILVGLMLLCITKGELHLMLCQPHTSWLDALVPIFTNLVDWMPYLCVVILLFYHLGWASFLASNLILSTIIVQPIKHLLHAPRPITWFAENMPDITLPLVEGVRMNHWLSFPSGHTTTFFVLFYTISLILCKEDIKGKYILSFACFLLASFGAYTRIYLSQHFALDILGGIFIALSSTLILYFFFAKKVENKAFWNKKLLK